jgi:hypothetical protein
VERAMSVTALVGWGKGCNPNIKPKIMMYYCAIIDGMPASYPDGKGAYAESYFGTTNYKYLKSLHRKSMSSTRGEFSGIKGIRGIFSEKESYRPENAETEEDVKACEEKTKKFLKGKSSSIPVQRKKPRLPGIRRTRAGLDLYCRPYGSRYQTRTNTCRPAP